MRNDRYTLTSAVMLWNRWLWPELHHTQCVRRARRGWRKRHWTTEADRCVIGSQRRQQLGESACLRQTQVPRRQRIPRVSRWLPGTHLSTWRRQQTNTGTHQLRVYDITQPV